MVSGLKAGHTATFGQCENRDSCRVRPQPLAPWVAPAVLVYCQISFAVMHITAHNALIYIPPFPFAWLRVSMALPLLLCTAKLKENFMPPWRELPYLAALGLLGVAGPQSLIFLGNTLAGAALVSITAPTTPVFVSLLSAVFRIERFTWGKVVGIMASVAGALMLVEVDHLNFHKNSTLGVAITLAGAASYASFLVLLQVVLQRAPHPLTLFACATLFGDACIGAVAVPRMPGVAWGAVPWSAWAALAYAGVMISFAAHACMSWAVKQCSATLPGLSGCLQPVFTVVLALVFLGEAVQVRDVFAMLLIIVGLLIVLRAKHLDDRAQQPEQRGASCTAYVIIERKLSEKGPGVQQSSVELPLAPLPASSFPVQTAAAVGRSHPVGDIPRTGPGTWGMLQSWARVVQQQRNSGAVASSMAEQDYHEEQHLLKAHDTALNLETDLELRQLVDLESGSQIYG